MIGYDIDATVQRINTPSLEWEEASKFFIGKHGIYCLKTQLIVRLNRLSVYAATGYEGSIHDKLLFDQSIEDFDDKIICFHTDGSILIIGDKVYQDENYSKIITPFKSNYYNLEPEQLKFNEKLGKVSIFIDTNLKNLSFNERKYRFKSFFKMFYSRVI